MHNMPVQREGFEANLPPNAEDAGIVKIKAYGYDERNSPYYPSIVVYATAKIKTLFRAYSRMIYDHGMRFGCNFIPGR